MPKIKEKWEILTRDNARIGYKIKSNKRVDRPIEGVITYVNANHIVVFGKRKKQYWAIDSMEEHAAQAAGILEPRQIEIATYWQHSNNNEIHLGKAKLYINNIIEKEYKRTKLCVKCRKIGAAFTGGYCQDCNSIPL